MKLGTVLAIILAIGLSYTDGITVDEETGWLTVDEEDMKNLESSITNDKDRGGKLASVFKKEVPKSITDLKQLSCHHIIPNNQIEEFPRSIESVEKYINEPHIKHIFEKYNLVSKPKHIHGKAIHASISWNPHNLVRGPIPSIRYDDPKSEIDHELLKKQSKTFQDAVKLCVAADKSKDSLENFGKLPRAEPVEFELDPSTKKYKVKEVKSKRAEFYPTPVSIGQPHDLVEVAENEFSMINRGTRHRMEDDFDTACFPSPDREATPPSAAPPKSIRSRSVAVRRCYHQTVGIAITPAMLTGALKNPPDRVRALRKPRFTNPSPPLVGPMKQKQQRLDTATCVESMEEGQIDAVSADINAKNRLTVSLW